MVMSPAGGFSVISADLCEKAGFEFADMGEDFYESLKQFSNAGVINFTNPLDMGDIYDPQLMAHVIFQVMHSDRVDGSIFISQRPQMPQGDDVFHKMFLTDLSKEAWGSILSSGKPLGVSLFGPMQMIQQTKRTVKFPIFNSPEELVNALAVQMKYYEHQRKRRDQKEAAPPPGIDRRAAERWLQGKQGDYGEAVLELLAAYGIPVAVSRMAASKEEALRHARELGYPVVMKVVSPDALHKTDAGGVMLGIEGPEQVGQSFDLIRANLLRHRQEARFEGCGSKTGPGRP